MSRLPFDPANAHGPGPRPRNGDSDKPARRERKRYSRITDAERITVSELAGLIKSTLEQRIPSPLRVVGEISNFSARNHWYFSLKDDSAVVSCVAWASSVKKLGITPKDGDEVLATGHISHYAPQGRTQLYVTNLQPVGAGALQLKFKAMCEELRKLGYFEETRKKSLPLLPRRIAVITSSGGAAVHDVISTAAQRCRAVGLLIIDVRVQGDGAAEDIAKTIAWVDAKHGELGVDAILATRGGGSIEDLWAFNERIVVDAAYRCSIPIVAAIGHESDTTVIELVADLRASTPTQAAMRLVPSGDELSQQIEHYEHRLTSLIQRRVERGREQLDHLGRQELFRDPGSIVERARDRLDGISRDLRRTFRSRLALQRARFEQLAGRFTPLQPGAIVARRHERLAVLSDRLDRVFRIRLDQRPRLKTLRSRLNHAAKRHVHLCDRQLVAIQRELTAVDPRQVLKRGYSYTTGPRNSVIRSIGDVRVGDRLLTHLADGSIESTAGKSIRRRSRPKSTRGTGSTGVQTSGGGGQMDLFGSSE